MMIPIKKLMLGSVLASGLLFSGANLRADFSSTASTARVVFSTAERVARFEYEARVVREGVRFFVGATLSFLGAIFSLLDGIANNYNHIRVLNNMRIVSFNP